MYDNGVISPNMPPPRNLSITQSGVVPGSHQNRSEDRTNSASPQRCQTDAADLQPRCQPGSHGRSGRNANCDFEPRSGPKRTESRLKKIRLAVSLWASFSCTTAFLDTPRMRTKSGLALNRWL